jgi:hypothetical protein
VIALVAVIISEMVKDQKAGKNPPVATAAATRQLGQCHWHRQGKMIPQGARLSGAPYYFLAKQPRLASMLSE